MNDWPDEIDKEEVESIVKHILPGWILEDILSDFIKGKESKRLTDKIPTPGYPEGAIIPNIRTCKSYLMNPSRFDTCVKLIKTLAIDRKKSMIIYCFRFSPRVLMLGLMGSLTNIPIKRLLNYRLKDGDPRQIPSVTIDLKDIPVVFLQDADLDYQLFLANLELLKEWFFPEVILFDDCMSFHDENNSGESSGLDAVRGEFEIFAKEQSLAVVVVT